MATGPDFQGRGPGFQSLIRELDPTATRKIEDPSCHN